MTTVTYALQVTLISLEGRPIMRCWGPVFEVVDGVPSDPGWHHFIVSFDSGVPRMQMAMDRGGGPIFGGAIMDTNTGSGVINATGGFPAIADHVNGQMYAKLVGTSLRGFNPTPGRVSVGRQWEFNADNTNDTDFAYFYGGLTENFFNLNSSTGSIPNLNFFISPGLAPVNFGSGASVVPLTVPLFMHTGNATLSPDVPVGAWNSSFKYSAGAYVSTSGAGGLQYWVALELPSVFGPNIDKNPLEWGNPFGTEEFAIPPEPWGPFGPTYPGILDWRWAGSPVRIPQNWTGKFFWKEVPKPYGPEFCYNGVFGLLGTFDANGISTTDHP